MEKQCKLGVIGGGFMAQAIVLGAIGQRFLRPDEVIVSDPSEARRDYFASLGIETTLLNRVAAERSSYLLLSVKPQTLPEVAARLCDVVLPPVISIMAGVKKDNIRAALETNAPIARVMPNLPCSVGMGMAAIDVSEMAQDGQEFVFGLFGATGLTLSVREEALNAVTALSGSGPAYVYLFLQALIDGGMRCGLEEQDARLLAIQTLKGGAAMAEANPDTPLEELIKAVSSKGGTTLAALEVLRRNDFPETVVKAIHGGWGAILIYGEHRREFSGGEPQTTNNRMELTAVIEGLMKLKFPCRVDVYSDSAYTVNGFLQGWVYGWEKMGWKKADKKPVLNDDLWKQLLALTREHEVTFHKVKGHADNPLNNRCDELARGAIDELRMKGQA